VLAVRWYLRLGLSYRDNTPHLGLRSVRSRLLRETQFGRNHGKEFSLRTDHSYAPYVRVTRGGTSGEEPVGSLRRGKLPVLVAAAAATAGMVVMGVASGTTSAGATPNPPGNNGTIKVDGVEFDDLPNNEPHVGCTFQIDFYGFDEGDLNADVSFDLQPPTLREGDDQNLLTDTVFIGEDDNSGGGSEAGLDASVTYTLDFTGVTPHPIQGFHVKLTIHADGSQGADPKYKVFWVTGCGETSPPPTTPPPTSPTPSTSG
jgi:hypothetical protein